MVHLTVKNLKEVKEVFHKEIWSVCEEKQAFYDERLKNYGKDVQLTVIFDHSSATYKVSASLDLKSKKLLVVEEDTDPVKALHAVFQALKKAFRHQYEKEKKDYLYKRKR